jgi:hypothetical protein
MNRPLALLAGLLLVAGCSATPGQSNDDTPVKTGGSSGASAGQGTVDPAEAGSVGFALTLPDGESIATVQWVIAGPDGAATVVTSGSVDVHNAGGTSFTVPLLRAANGYRVALSAVATDAGVSCAGSASFDVHIRQTTSVAVRLACNLASAGGHTTLVNGTGFDCAAWTSVTASPIEVAVGGQVSLAAMATGPVPENITYSWTAPSGQFTAPDAASTGFTCTNPGPVVVTLVVGDGPVPAGSSCNPALTTDTVTVTCTGMTGMTDAGTPPPPPAAPAVPGWGLLGLAAAFALAGRKALLGQRTAG